MAPGGGGGGGCGGEEPRRGRWLDPAGGEQFEQRTQGPGWARACEPQTRRALEKAGTRTPRVGQRCTHPPAAMESAAEANGRRYRGAALGRVALAKMERLERPALAALDAEFDYGQLTADQIAQLYQLVQLDKKAEFLRTLDLFHPAGLGLVR